MKVLERYSCAVNSVNLGSDPRSTWSDSDVLGAAGFAAKYEALGIALTRLFADGRPEQCIAILSDLAFRRARTVRVRLSGLEAADLAKAVLGWYRHGTCQPCGGTGFQTIPDTPMQGDECSRCGGSGRMPFDQQFPADTLPLARWLSREIDRSQAAAGQEVMKMVAPLLHF